MSVFVCVVCLLCKEQQAIHLFLLVVFVHVFPHASMVVWVGGCVGWWVCVNRMHPAFIIQPFLCAAGLPSTVQAQMAFDNGLNRQMPGRHSAIDHSSGHCFHFPAKLQESSI